MDEPVKSTYEDQPLIRQEYVQAVIHYYRGEMQRATTWRSRLDLTTNWAVVVTITAISYCFSSLDHPHAILLASNWMVFLLLWIEARRYRFYDVWRTRLRTVEVNFFGPLLRREPRGPENEWGGFLAEDLRAPTFKIGFLPALKMRLRRNYLALFGISLAVWLVKTGIAAGQCTGICATLPFRVRLFQAMAFHSIPPEVVLALQAAFYLMVAGIGLLVKMPGGFSDEIHEVSGRKDFWDR